VLPGQHDRGDQPHAVDRVWRSSSAGLGAVRIHAVPPASRACRRRSLSPSGVLRPWIGEPATTSSTSAHVPTRRARTRARIPRIRNQYEDGTPSFYMADTAWKPFHRLNQEKPAAISRIARKGFTVTRSQRREAPRAGVADQDRAWSRQHRNLARLLRDADDASAGRGARA
jgi:hypothetical protein